jgi:tryptophanyl-tRNA synthetase
LFPEPEALISDAPLLLGTDGQKMSKSRGNAIAIGATEDETARLIGAAKADSERRITFDPAARPEASNLVLLAALCLERDPRAIADEVGERGSAGLKRVVIQAVNERLRPVWERRRALAEERGHLRQILRTGAETAGAIAAEPWMPRVG